jgi:lipopolysaccharide export system permease protein
LKKLDIYIIKKFLGTFFFTIMLCTIIAISIDFFEKIDRFLDSSASAWEIFTGYILNFIPWINGLLWPLFTFIAVIFFTSRMAKNSEIIAILSSGVSYRRFLVPYFIGGCIVAALLYVGNHYVIPNSNKLKNEFETEVFKKRNIKTLDNNIHFFISPNEKIYGRRYNRTDSIVETFRLETFDESGALKRILKADRLLYNSDSSTWTMKNYEYRFINGMDEELSIHKGEEKDTIIDIYPKDFMRYTHQSEMLSTPALKAFIEEEQGRGIDAASSYLVELHRRTAYPFTLIILTILGASIASRKVRGGMGYHLALGAILGALLEILSKFSMTFSSNMGMSPLLGVWVPNIIFIFVAWYMIGKAQK